MKLIISFLLGIIFGIGLILSEMTNPQKVIGFLDWFGHWDYTLLLVLSGAVITAAVGYTLIFKLDKPILTNNFEVPQSRIIDKKLFIGSAIFGIGWGLSGYCPGPATANLSSNTSEAAIFLGFMVIGFFIARKLSSGISQ
ncbi:MAG: DUF6691 family protein [Marinicellaceae bacterium]